MQSSAAAGAQAGAAFGPYGALIGAGVGVASDVMNQALGGTTSSGGENDIRSSFDGSGWTVSTGKSSATGARDSRTAAPLGVGEGMTRAVADSPWLLFAALGIVGFILYKKL